MRTYPMALRGISTPLIAAMFPTLAQAQGGRISGVVTDVARQPVTGAQVLVPAAGLSARTGDDGAFVVRGVPTGTYLLQVFRVGFKPKDVPGVSVTRGVPTSVSVTLEPTPVQLGGIVVSASRRVEKITDAPATVIRLDSAQIETTIGNSFVPALKAVNGIEFIQVGVTAVVFNARGFNTSFNNRLLMMEDGRIATIPESGLPVSLQTTIAKVDLAGVEMLVGPGAALYGPDASNGVLTLETKDPKQYPGWTVELSGGTRSFYDVQGRYAKLVGKLAFKVSGERQAAKDWATNIFYPAVAAGGQPIAEKNPDFDTDITRGSGAVAWYFNNGGRLNATVGASRTNGIGQTSVGRNQLVNYDYRNYQLQYTGSRWFTQAYMTNSITNGTFALNGYSQNSVRYPTLATDSLKRLSAFPAEGRIQAAEIQNNFALGALVQSGISALDHTHVVWGGQLRRDRVSSYQRWLSDRATGKPIVRDERGGYVQIETPLSEQLRVVAAARYDTHEKYPAQFSPKAAVLYTPVADHTLRVTANRAYKSPTVLQTDIFFPNLQPFVGVFGNADGFDIKKSDGTIVSTIGAVKPETNTTWELGYKAAMANRLFVDVAGYQSHFRDFLSPLVTIANPLTPTTATTFPTTAYNHRTGAKVTDPAGGPQVTLTYFNVGEAVIRGLEAGLRFYFTDRLSASATASLINVDTIKSKPTDPPEATSFNSASTRANIGMEYQGKQVGAGFLARYVNGYDFRGGVNFGRIPSFGTLDFSASYRLSNAPIRFTLQAQNLLSCVSGTSTPPAIGINASPTSGRATYVGDQKCGFGQKHTEMLNMSPVGAMVLLGMSIAGR